MDTFLKDLRYAGRGLFRNPGVSVIAVLALGLGIGLTAVMFSIVYGALYRGLPFDGAERIMTLDESRPAQGYEGMAVSIHDYTDWRARQRSFEDLGALFQGTVNVRGSERPERYDGAFMTANTLEILGVQPILGRGFTQDDMQPGAPMALLLGYRAWQQRFGGDRDVVGRSVTVNGEAGQVVGVLPEGFAFPELQEVWVPLRLDPVAIPRGEGQSVSVFGKLREGVSVDQAMVEFSGIASQLASEHPETNEGVVARIRPYTEAFMGNEERGILLTMLATVVMVLLIACANVANLLLARAAVRTRDVAIRTAMGASRARVIVQLMGEAGVLAAAGAVLGTAVAWVGITLFARAVAGTDPPFWFQFTLDLPILAFVVGISALAALVSGAIPALRASATDVNSVLKDESRGSSGLHIGRLSRWLVVAEVAMSVALLVASGLLVKSAVRVDRMALPFPSENVFTARVGVFEERFPDASARLRFWDDVEGRLAALPGVRAAGLGTSLPGQGANNGRLAVDGESYTEDRDLPTARWAAVTPGYLEAFQVEALQGRTLNRLDGADAAPVVVVNESFARDHFPDGQVLGRRIRLGGLDSTDPWREIVGVVPDLGMEGVGDPDDDPPAGFYLPLAQYDTRFVSLAARVDGQPLALTAQVRDAVAAADPDTPIYWVDTLRGRIDDNLWFYRVFGTLFAAFGVAALFLASVGLYGVMSFSVSRRAPEMGIRMALGAEGRQVRSLVMRQGMRQIALGLVLGTGLAVLVARGLGILLYEAKPWDPTTYLGVFALLTLTGLAATLVPALRATRVAPVEALRSE